MRPRVKSYGESSTATLSPARIRMKFLRILPETCASTLCLFSSSTRNIALGSGSITVAITSIASSFELPESSFFFSSNGFAINSYFSLVPKLTRLPRRPGHFLRPGQNPRAVCGDGHSVFKVSRGATIGGFRHPLSPHLHIGLTGIDHGFNRNDHAFLQSRATSWFAVVREIGLVMHFGADTVPDKFPHYRITVLLHPTLHRVSNIAQSGS